MRTKKRESEKEAAAAAAAAAAARDFLGISDLEVEETEVIAHMSRTRPESEDFEVPPCCN